MLKLTLLAVALTLASCTPAPKKPIALKSAMVRRIAALRTVTVYGSDTNLPHGLYVTWGNDEIWRANILEFKTNLNESWEIYAYITNGQTKTPWVKVENEYAHCFFRVGTLSHF